MKSGTPGAFIQPFGSLENQNKFCVSTERSSSAGSSRTTFLKHATHGSHKKPSRGQASQPRAQVCPRYNTLFYLSCMFAGHCQGWRLELRAGVGCDSLRLLSQPGLCRLGESAGLSSTVYKTPSALSTTVQRGSRCATTPAGQLILTPRMFECTLSGTLTTFPPALRRALLHRQHRSIRGASPLASGMCACRTLRPEPKHICVSNAQLAFRQSSKQSALDLMCASTIRFFRLIRWCCNCIGSLVPGSCSQWKATLCCHLCDRISARVSVCAGAFIAYSSCHGCCSFT